jgi:hypothetical protein
VVVRLPGLAWRRISTTTCARFVVGSSLFKFEMEFVNAFCFDGGRTLSEVTPCKGMGPRCGSGCFLLLCARIKHKVQITNAMTVIDATIATFVFIFKLRVYVLPTLIFLH